MGDGPTERLRRRRVSLVERVGLEEHEEVLHALEHADRSFEGGFALLWHVPKRSQASIEGLEMVLQVTKNCELGGSLITDILPLPAKGTKCGFKSPEVRKTTFVLSYAAPIQ